MKAFEIKLNPEGTIFGDLNNKLSHDIARDIRRYLDLVEVEDITKEHAISGVMSVLTSIIVSLEYRTPLPEGLIDYMLKTTRELMKDGISSRRSLGRARSQDR